MRLTVAVLLLASATAALRRDPVHIASILNGNFHVEDVPEQDLLVSKSGYGPGATGVDVPSHEASDGTAAFRFRAEPSSGSIIAPLKGLAKKYNVACDVDHSEGSLTDCLKALKAKNEAQVDALDLRCTAEVRFEVDVGVLLGFAVRAHCNPPPPHTHAHAYPPG